MKKIYVVVHEYDTDGGFGDAVRTQDIVGAFTSHNRAYKYARKYSKKEVYDEPYNSLERGRLKVIPVELDALQDSPFLKTSFPTVE